MPKGSSPTRLKAIINYGAEASITTLNYDDTVIYAKQKAQEEGWILLQDTSWEGYEKVPQYIMQGYCTLVTEYLNQEQDIWPTHVFIQAGVGSLAAAILAYLHNLSARPTPKFIVVEPQGAPCLYESIRLNEVKPFRVTGDLHTIMAGLACGEPSHIGWDILKSATNAFLMCSDDVTRRGMKVLGNPLGGDQRIISGESGAVTLGALFEILSNEQFYKIKDVLNLTSIQEYCYFLPREIPILRCIATLFGYKIHNKSLKPTVTRVTLFAAKAKPAPRYGSSVPPFYVQIIFSSNTQELRLFRSWW